ncbi:MAG: glycerate kinase [Anaerolineales bacterium]|nr:glycerate kinase [Anaerolineales bacterium]
MHADLWRCARAALAAVDPRAAVRRYLQVEPGPVTRLRLDSGEWTLRPENRIVLVAVGKAAAPMAEAAAALLGPKLSAGIVVTKYGHAAGVQLPSTLTLIEAGHPVPDANGLAGAHRITELAGGLSAGDLLLVLLSGGASALLPAPAPGLTLDDVQALTTLLLRAGATIAEINAVRKHTDRLKGGGLARLAQPASVIALILSDVVGDPLEVIASGPTVPDSTTFADVWAMLARYRLTEQLPSAIAAHLQAGLAGTLPETPKPGDPLFERVTNVLVGSNRQAAQAALREAERLGYRPLLLGTFIEGEAREVGRVTAALAKSVRVHGDPLSPPACLVWGGETTVTVRGSGRGGRNQELALAAALALDGVPGVALMAFGTDGTDGPTDAAGGLVDGGTAARARALGLDLWQALADNNSYPALDALGALVKTGPTGTNVNDLLILLVK